MTEFLGPVWDAWMIGAVAAIPFGLFLFLLAMGYLLEKVGMRNEIWAMPLYMALISVLGVVWVVLTADVMFRLRERSKIWNVCSTYANGHDPLNACPEWVRAALPGGGHEVR